MWRVVPLLVGGAKMPLQQELPESLQLLVRHQAVEVSDTHFTRDVADLIQSLERLGNKPRFDVRKRIKSGLVAALFLLLLMAAGIGVSTWQTGRHEREHAEATRHLGHLVNPSSPVNPPKAAVDANIRGVAISVRWIAQIGYKLS